MTPTPILLSAADAARSCGVSLRTWRSMDAAGRIPRPIALGRRLLWSADVLRRWAAAGGPDRASWEREVRRAR